MDTSDSKIPSDKKKPKAETTRLPLVSSENKYGTTRRSQTREVSSRGRSPSPSPAPVSKRCPSPNASTRTSNSTLSVPKRAVSTERKRPSTPASTPVHDTTLGSRKNPESSSLWPSTTRSHDASAPIGKREKQQPVSLSRSSTPERKSFSADVAENSRHSSRWPGRAAAASSAVKASNNSKIDNITKTTPSLFNFRTAVAPSSCTRRLFLDGTSKPLQKSSTDLLKLISREEMFSGSSVDNDDDDFDATTTRRQSLPGSGAHGISASVSRRVSPSRGTSPATIRQSSPSRQPQNSSPVLGLTADINEKITKTTPSLFNFKTAVAPSSCTRRLSLDGASKPQQKSSTDLLKLISHEEMFSGSSVDNDDEFDATTVRRQSLPGSGAHSMSPSVSGRVSPATIRQSSPSRQPQNSASVPGFTSDINEKKTKTTPSLFNFRTAVAPSSCTRRLSLDGASKPLLKSSTDLLKLISHEEMFSGSSVDNDDEFDATTVRRQSLPGSGAHGTLPSVSRRVSPATIRQSSPSRQPQNSSSVLGFTSDINEKKTKTTPSLFNFRTAVAPSSCTRRLSLDGTSKPLLKSSTDLLKLISREEMFNGSSVGNDDDDDFDATTTRRQSLPSSGAHGISPSVSRRVSPSRGRSVTPSCSRGASPTRIIRPSSPSRQPQNSIFVPGFIADVKKGKKVENNAEDAHQLRLLYNRHLQWRYANARNIDALHSQKAKAEKIFYGVWRIILDLWDVVTEKRSDLKQLRLKLKICSILDKQMNYLNKWASIERCHASSLTCIIEDLQSSTILVPVTGGATVDIKTVTSAVCAAVDVMMEIGSSLCSFIPQVEGTNSLVSKLADVAAYERAMLDECESLLRSTAALQVEEDSLRTQLLLIKQDPSVYG